MNDGLTWAQAQDLITTILANIRAGGGVEDGTYSLQEVAERCNISLSSLIKDCRADRLEHVGKGDHRSMTPTQVARMLATFTRGGDLAIHQSAAKDAMAEARAASKRAASRQAPRRVA